jgi:hypothetical protein
MVGVFSYNIFILPKLMAFEHQFNWLLLTSSGI